MRECIAILIQSLDQTHDDQWHDSKDGEVHQGKRKHFSRCRLGADVAIACGRRGGPRPIETVGEVVPFNRHEQEREDQQQCCIGKYQFLERIGRRLPKSRNG